VVNILFYLDLITLTCFDQSWSSSEGSFFNQYNITIKKGVYYFHFVTILVTREGVWFGNVKKIGKVVPVFLTSALAGGEWSVPAALTWGKAAVTIE
jgi:hypothetical protein